MNLHTNPQLELAYQYVCNTNKNLFLTGKAGSGKTTFLHKIREARVKRMAIVAPTGVAAINAGGMTIHSLFQIPIGLHLPGVERRQPPARFRAEKVRLIRSLDLLVIDEVSMVRADLLDAIDEVLKKVRNQSQPFGGVQLLMIGDLHQLPPVVKPEDWELLRRHYKTPYFFGSQSLQATDYIAIELKHIYRQADPEFIALLNQVRDNRLDQSALLKLNSRYLPDFYPPTETPYITLTATNAAASEINSQNLERLSTAKVTFTAKIDGDFPASSFPTDENLELKVGAQVMFIRNDSSNERLFFNGKLGNITRITDNNIAVRSPNDNRDIVIEPIIWENIKYTLNEQTKEIEEQVIGSFTQYPLRHAWAITIHKSQGLTFERCIIDAQAAFASGQVYVALSRCKSFEGIVLRTRIVPNSVKTDPVVQDFSNEAEKNLPTESQLRAAKLECQTKALHFLFQFDGLAESLGKMISLCRHHARSLNMDAHLPLETLKQKVHIDLQQVASKFAPQLATYLQADELPEDNEPLQMRLRKAAIYFSEKLSLLNQELANIRLETDNKEIAKQLQTNIQALNQTITTQKLCFAACQEGFSTDRVNRAKCHAELDSQRKESQGESFSAIPQEIAHPILYQRLLAWRAETATRQGLPEFDVAPNLTLRSLVDMLPKTKKQLRNVGGIGKARLQKYGDELLELIGTFCDEKHPSSSTVQNITRTNNSDRERSSTKTISLYLYRNGMPPEVIAKERRLSISTILAHLTHFIETGELEVSQFLDKATIDELLHYFAANSQATLSKAKEHFGEKYDYWQLRMAVAECSRRQESAEL
jgi:hypothetical protein